MHSRIFELYTNDTIEEKLTEDEVLELVQYVNTSADYVIEQFNERRKDSIEWIGQNFGNVLKISTEKEEFIFNKETPSIYFMPKFAQFKKAIKDLDSYVSSKSVEIMTGPTDLSYKMYILTNLYEEKDGFLILYEREVMSLDYFIRYIGPSLLQSDIEITLHFGKVYDYHM